MKPKINWRKYDLSPLHCPECGSDLEVRIDNDSQYLCIGCNEHWIIVKVR